MVSRKRSQGLRSEAFKVEKQGKEQIKVNAAKKDAPMHEGPDSAGLSTE
jgi:hypothetical protein